jgi:drug/metabolite transporter (DMT)-like permease
MRLEHRARARDPEVVGFGLSLAFVALAAVRDVYFGGLLQHVHPLVVAVTAFALCSVSFGAWAVLRDRASLAMLLRRPGKLAAINATTAAAWLSFFFALRAIEPALVQVLFFGVGPLAVRALDRWLVGAASSGLTHTEQRLQRGLLGALGGAAIVVLAGVSGAGPQPLLASVGGVALALGGGASIAASPVLCRGVNDEGVRPAALLALRFPGAAVMAALLALGVPDARAALSPHVVAAVAAAALLLIVLPNYISQVGTALASPVTTRAVLALGPVAVFALQAIEARLSPSPWTLAASTAYAVVAIASALERRRAIAAVPAISPARP